jgi:NAD dependent epimerase/dehydratase family enzyme
MSAIVLESQRVSSRKIEDLGFEFKFYEIETALDDLM